MTESPIPPAEAGEPDPLAFTPVPVSGRHDGWTARRQQDFIAALSVMGVVSRAARAVGMTKQSAYKLRARPGAESFAEAWDVALLMGYDRFYGEAIDRAINGVVSERYYKGKLVGMRRRYDYRLAFGAILEPLARARNNPAG